jgi:hypothetical protein
MEGESQRKQSRTRKFIYHARERDIKHSLLQYAHDVFPSVIVGKGIVESPDDDEQILSTVELQQSAIGRDESEEGSSEPRM